MSYCSNSIHADTNEAMILSSNAEIPVGNSSVCIFVVANDDPIAEYEESVQIIVTPDNDLDMVIDNQNTTFVIIDNDGPYNDFNE